MTNQIQNRDFHHALVEVGRSVLDDLDSDDFLGLEILTFHDLSKCSLAEDIKYKVTVPINEVRDVAPWKVILEATILVASFLGAQDIIDVKNVIAVFIVIPIIL